MQTRFFRLVTYVLVAMAGAATYFYFAKFPQPMAAGGFTVKVISSNLTPNLAWDIEVPPERMQQVLNIVSQNYYYLGRGSQSFAFISEDKKHVIKFFRHLHFKPAERQFLGFTWSDEGVLQRHISKGKKLNRLFGGYKIGYERTPKETGVLYVHFNKTENLFSKPLCLYDSLGKKHEVDLGNCQFVIQERAYPIKTTIIDLMSQEKREEAQERLAQLIDMVQKHALAGCYDRDEAWIHNNNVGFTQDGAIFIDMGYIVLENRLNTVEAYSQYLDRFSLLETWLTKNYPDLLPEFLEKKASSCKEYAQILQQRNQTISSL